MPTTLNPLDLIAIDASTQFESVISIWVMIRMTWMTCISLIIGASYSRVIAVTRFWSATMSVTANGFHVTAKSGKQSPEKFIN